MTCPLCVLRRPCMSSSGTVAFGSCMERFSARLSDQGGGAYTEPESVFQLYYNDEVIIPRLSDRGLSMQTRVQYNIIGCVEPQKAGKTEGWHDAAFFNMCRPLELVFCQRYGSRRSAWQTDR